MRSLLDCAKRLISRIYWWAPEECWPNEIWTDCLQQVCRPPSWGVWHGMLEHGQGMLAPVPHRQRVVPCRVPGPTTAGAAAWARAHLGPWAWPLVWPSSAHMWLQLCKGHSESSGKNLFGFHCVALRGLAFHQLTWVTSGRRLYTSLFDLCNLYSWHFIPTYLCSGFSRSLLVMKNRVLKM